MTSTEIAATEAAAPEADPLAASARLHEYSRAANPVGRHAPRIPIRQFPAALHRGLDRTAVVDLDLSSELGIEGPATSPALRASFVHVEPGDDLTTEPVATSELVFVLAGRGATTTAEGTVVGWEAGDLFVVPAGLRSVHAAVEPATFYRVTDEPLLRHLGVAPTEARFPTTRFRGTELRAELARIEADPHALDRNRLSVLMATAEQTRTLTVTNVLWAMYGVVPPGAVQQPHRHQSVALDLILDAPPGCYTLVGRSLSPEGEIVDPVRVDWESGGAFTTPPGLWHAHHNESDQPAHLLPVQDAGLLTHLTALDIRFA